MSIQKEGTQAPIVIEEGEAGIDQVPNTSAQLNFGELGGVMGHGGVNGAWAIAGGDLDEDGRRRHGHIAIVAAERRALGALLADSRRSAEYEAQIREAKTPWVDARSDAPWAPCAREQVNGANGEASLAMGANGRASLETDIDGQAPLGTSIDGNEPLALSIKLVIHCGGSTPRPAGQG
ncbi:unnamed protein product [Ilex paraguariensis]|uniref:Uncharacterized protein n=1 Tax=Ilex paraguariensis TaxID=185542 RepID=A0ABC8R022_9AQUA